MVVEMVALKEEEFSETKFLTNSVPALGQGQKKISSTTRATTTTRMERFALNPREKHLIDKPESHRRFRSQVRRWCVGTKRQDTAHTGRGANIALGGPQITRLIRREMNNR